MKNFSGFFRFKGWTSHLVGLSLFFAMNLSLLHGQTIQTVNPMTTDAGQNITMIITGTNTNFTVATGAYLRHSGGAATYLANNFVASNATHANMQFSIPPNAPLGNYHLMSYNNFITYNNALNVSIGPNSTYGFISGKMIFDVNGNCTQDVGDSPVSGAVITLSPGPFYLTAGSNGEFSGWVPNGNYTLSSTSFIGSGSWVCPVGGTQPGNIPTNLSQDINNDFYWQATPCADQSILLHIPLLRPGFTTTISGQFINTGNTAVSNTTATMTIDPGLVYGGASPAPTSVVGNVITWNFANTNANQIHYVTVTVTIPALTPLGTPMAFSSSWPAVGPDPNLANNSVNRNSAVQGSFDPNDKQVWDMNGNNADGPVDSTTTRLSYLIRCQNTGTDTAFNIFVRDTLDPRLNAGSLRITGASHPYQFSLTGTRYVQFTFPNILLQDSFSNEPASHAFIAYEIDLNPGVPTHSTITNSASIYFDYNLPVPTNKTATTLGFPIIANVNVAGALVGNGNYATLREAFNAINAGAQGGTNIVITILNSTYEGSTSAILNQSSAPWASLTIQPSGGAWTISGTSIEGQPLIDFNGADNVTVDGLNSSGNSLTIQNATYSGVSGTSTIRFQGDATNNTITRCAIQGSSMMSTTTDGGTILFGAAAIATGNDNNTISFCDIGPASANLPAKAISGSGTTTTTALYNSGNQILNCNIFDYFHGSAQSNGIYLGAGNSTWTISNNRLFQTAPRTQASGAIHSGIQVASTIGNDGHSILNNTIGYSSAAGTGTYTLSGPASSTKFFPIYISGALVNPSAPNSIQGNTVTNIALSGPLSGTGGNSPFAGILVTSGLANIGTVSGNVVGSATTPGVITFSSTSGSSAEVYGIYYSVTQSTTISNNQIGGMAIGNSSSGGVVFSGIRVTSGSTFINTIQNNTIGFAAAPIGHTAVGAASRMIGIYSQTGASQIANNTVGYLSMAAANVGTGITAGMIGILADHTAATQAINISQNNVLAIKNTVPSAATVVAGIVYNGPNTATNSVARNNIHTLGAASPTATAHGIHTLAGIVTYQNNMVRLGYDDSGVAFTACGMVGINVTSGTSNFYHNSVYVGGSGVSSAANSFAFQSTVTTVRNYQNNIFYNARSNGAGTGKHYAIRVGGTVPNPAGLTTNYNDLLANGTGGILGLFNAVDRPNLAAWQTATGQDNNSISSDPMYLNPTGTALTGDLHIGTAPTAIESQGLAIGSVTNDFDGQSRAGLTPTDIGADAGNFTSTLGCVTAIAGTATGTTSFCTSGSTTVLATGYSSGTGSTYSWQSSPAGMNTWTATGGVNPNGYSTGTVSASTDFRLRVTCATNSSVDTSNVVTITINPAVTPTVAIFANPGTTICAGTSVTFTATPTNGGDTPSFQWKKNGGNVGTNSTTYVDAGLLNGDQITVELTSNALCAAPTTVTSNTLAMTVNPVVTPSVTIAANPGTTVCTGTSVMFTATPVNGGISPTYQWKKNGGNVGTNSPTYTDAGLLNGDQITCDLGSSEACTSPASATSNTLTISVVTSVTPSVSIAVNPGTTICPSSTATFTATAVNAGTTPVYQWKLNGGNVGTNSATYINSTLITSDQVMCEVTSNDPCASPVNATSNTIMMTVTDVTPPTAACQNLTVSLNASGNVSTTASVVNNSSSDNCTASGSLSLSLNTSVFTCANLGANAVMLTVTDQASNTGTCNATVTVVDNLLPTISCPSNMSVNSGAGLCAATVTYSTPSGTDNCTPTTTQTVGLASSASFPVGVTTNTFRVTDGSGNSATCSFTVTVTDNEAPAITCPPNISVNNTPGQCAAVVTYSTPSGTDNCSATTSRTAGLASGATFPVGVTANTFRATDVASNSSTCSFTVTVVDAQAPTWSGCPSNMSVSTGAGVCTATVGWIAPSASDNCSGTTTSSTHTPGTFALGTTTVTYTATDASSNTSTCAFTVTVIDNTAPTATCQNVTVTLNAAGNGSTTAAAVNNGSADACGIGSVALNQTAFSCANVGINNVTLTVTDANSNTATCTATVTVVDNIAPTAMCQNVSVTLASGSGSTTAAAVNNGSLDACGAPGLGLSQTTFSCADVGTVTVTLTATDGSGNSSTCTATVTVTASAMVNAMTADTSTCGYGISCTGANDGAAHANVSEGCPTYTYLWSNGDTGSSTTTGLAPGMHYVTITDGTGATLVDSVLITEPSALSTVVNTVIASCSNDSSGSVDITSTGGNDCQGYTYLWSNGAVTADLSNVPAGSYTVTVTDAAGCTTLQTVTVSSLTAPLPSFTQTGNVLTSAQTWVTYQWLLNGNPISGANATSFIFTSSGTYSLLVTDTNGCQGISAPSTIVGIKDKIDEGLNLTLFPNPASGEFRLRTEVPIAYTLMVSITDMFGRKIAGVLLPELGRESIFSLQGFSAGTYIVEVLTEHGQRRMFKLVVQ